MIRGSIDWQICDELTDCPAGMTVEAMADELGCCHKSIYQALGRLRQLRLVEKAGSLQRRPANGREQTIWVMTRTKRIAA